MLTISHAKRLILLILILVVLTALLLNIPICILCSKDNLKALTSGDYNFDPVLVLSLRSQQVDEVFSAQERPSDSNLGQFPYTGTQGWTTSEFLQVANFFHVFRWKESMDKWHLREISYIFDCHNFQSGPYSASYSLYKYQWDAHKLEKVKHYISISLLDNSISWIEAAYDPGVEFEKPLNLSLVKISAESAIQIADSNLGDKIRGVVNNECFISLDLFPHGPYKGWWVRYLGYSYTDRLLEVDINTHSGLFVVTYPRPGLSVP